MAISASAEHQAVLLELQKHDTVLLQLNHRKNNLPQIAQVAELEAALADLQLRLVAIKTEISDISLAATKAENDVEQVVTRSQRDQQRLDSGAISNSKELEALQHEIASLAKRQSELEDIELEILQQLEEAKSVQTEIETSLSDVESKLAEAVAERDTELAQIDELAKTELVQRTVLAGSIDGALLALYDKVRIDLGGVGAALLHRGACQGCHISLDSSEINRIRDLPADEVVRCEQCRRILVRTAESGL